MPWTTDKPPDVAKNWTAEEKEKCVNAANAVLADGGSEEDAVFACIRASGRSEQEKSMSDWVNSSGNVFEDLGFDAAEAEVLKVKTQLKIELEKEVKRRKLSQTAAAKLAGVDRPMFNKVMTGKLTGVTIDKMVQMHSRLGKSVDVRVKKRQKRCAA